MRQLWTAKDVQTLLNLHAQGITPKEISAIMGWSRNAIIGRLNRNKTNGSRTPPRKIVVPKPEPRPLTKVDGGLNPLCSGPFPETADACRFIVGDSMKAFRACGRQQEIKSYCAHHHALTHYTVHFARSVV